MCGGPHLAANCDKRFGRPPQRSTPANPPRTTETIRKPARVFTCSANRLESLVNDECDYGHSIRDNIGTSLPPEQPVKPNAELNKQAETAVKGVLSLSRLFIEESTVNMLTSTGEVHALSTEATAIPDFSPLQYVNVEIQGINGCIAGMADTGAQISLCNRSVIQSLNLPVVGNLKIKGIIGDAHDADLVVIQIRIADSKDMPYIPIHCAVTDGINDVLILTANAIRRLTQRNDRCISQCDAAPLIINNTVTDGGEISSVNCDDVRMMRILMTILIMLLLLIILPCLPACSLDAQNNILTFQL
jgi:hypothetical protein